MHELSRHQSDSSARPRTARTARTAGRALAKSLLTALLLTIAAHSAAQRPAETAPLTNAAQAVAIPAACFAPLAADKMANVAAFIWAGCPQLLKWPHDKAVRMSGPAPSGSASVHGYVLNYYAPSVYAWLKAGRPAGGIPDGAVILKQMYADNGGVIGAPNGWALMVKQKSASFDGWLWGYADPAQPSGAGGGYGGQFYDPNCVACHGSSSSRELTFASLENIDTATAFGGTAMPVANGLKGGSVHAKLGLLSLLAPNSTLAANAAVAAIPNGIPSQATSRVIVGPNGATSFFTSDVCSGCHDASNLAFSVQSNMSWPPNTAPKNPPVANSLKNISPFGEWGASLMGLAGRDPVFQAQRESETLTYPSVKDEIDNTCYTCHGVMGKRQLDIDRPGTLFTHKHFLATSGPDAIYGGLARDGISCLACHRMTADGLGTQASFTGNFKVTGPQTVFGPFKDVATFPMQNAVGMTPLHGDAVSDPAMCGSCHVVETEILNKNVTYNRSTFSKQPKSHEQTTYLEWLNSRFQTKAAPGPGATPQTCQQCHMPRTVNGQPITAKIANIEDNTYVDASGKPFPNTAPAADITLKPRSEYSRHTFVGANVFVLEMLKQFRAQLGLTVDQTTGDPNYDLNNFSVLPRFDLAIAETTQQVQSESASVAIRATRKTANVLDVDVEVVNKTGHKFPSGVGFRRAFIEFTAMDGSGNIVWSSGRSTDKGVLIDDSGAPLVTEFSKTTWQPHWRIITGSKYAQIYESRTKDLQGLLTTSFLGLAKPVKDNRLMPGGWKPNGPYASWTLPVAVPMNASPGYYNGAGNDLVTYRMPANIASSVRLVRAVLHYQSIPPYYLKDRFDIGGNNPATAQLRALVLNVDYSKTAAKGWKLPVASASAFVR
jgi:mono/diheme cytochrome c family protein